MPHRTRSTIIVTALVVTLTATGRASDAPAAHPVEQLTTRPASEEEARQGDLRPTFSVHGQVRLAEGFGATRDDLRRVVVYCGPDAKLDALSAVPARQSVAQKNKAFVPNFLVISKGTEVEFPNWDHISHNVFSRSAAAPAFDLDRYPFGQSKTRIFDKVGVVQVFCNIHPLMRAIIFVTPNAFFVCADAQGHFEINALPAGRYELYAWQDRCATQHQPIEVGPASQAEADFVLDEEREAILANDPPRHAQRYGVERGLGLKRERLNLPVVIESHPAPTTEPCADCN